MFILCRTQSLDVQQFFSVVYSHLRASHLRERPIGKKAVCRVTSDAHKVFVAGLSRFFPHPAPCLGFWSNVQFGYAAFVCAPIRLLHRALSCFCERGAWGIMRSRRRGGGIHVPLSSTVIRSASLA